MATHIYDAKYWRARAAEIRAVAEGTRDPISKQLMLQIADDYQKLAEKCRAADYTNSTNPS